MRRLLLIILLLLAVIAVLLFTTTHENVKYHDASGSAGSICITCSVKGRG